MRKLPLLSAILVLRGQHPHPASLHAGIQGQGLTKAGKGDCAASLLPRALSLGCLFLFRSLSFIYSS